MPNSLSGAKVSVRHFCVRKTSALVPICLVVVVSDTGAEVWGVAHFRTSVTLTLTLTLTLT